MDYTEMDYNAITGLSNQIKQLYTDYSEMLIHLDSLVKSLDEIWVGRAKEEFMAVYKELKPKLNRVNSSLKQYSTSTSNAVAFERETEKQTSLTFKSI